MGEPTIIKDFPGEQVERERIAAKLNEDQRGVTHACALCAVGNEPHWFGGHMSHFVSIGERWVPCLAGDPDITQDQLAARKMRVLKEVPPNLERIAKVLPMARERSVMFCYGDIIYNPSGLPIVPWLIEHEKVHSIRQGDTSSGIEAWWDQYVVNKNFRFEEELPAHIVEYAAYRSIVKGDAKRKQELRRIAQRLAGPLYSVGMTPAEARRAIVEGKQNGTHRR